MPRGLGHVVQLGAENAAWPNLIFSSWFALGGLRDSSKCLTFSASGKGCRLPETIFDCRKVLVA
jgi:hypothetical protein